MCIDYLKTRFWKERRAFYSFRFRLINRNLPEIFEHKRCIFIHIPKAAGRSIATTIFGEGVGHLTYHDYEAVDFYKTRQYFSFSFTRNPYDRLVSAYFFLKKGGMSKYSDDQNFSKFILSNYDSFEEFVMQWLDKKTIYHYLHFIPQKWFVIDAKGNIGVNFVGKIENIDDDFSYIKKRIGLDDEVSLPKINKSEHGHFMDYYTDEMKNKVYELYKDDFKTFGYDK